MAEAAAPRSTIRGSLPRTIAAIAVITAAMMPTLLAGPAAPTAPALGGTRALEAKGGGPIPVSSSAPSFDRAGHVPGRPSTERHAGATRIDGVLPAGVTAFDGEYPGVGNLDGELLRALRHASTEAAVGGIELSITSGWRSAAFQDELLREAVTEYGSVEEAARWVATAETSPHVSGDAVDIGPAEAVAWLSARGARYGLCQVYRNEPWHFELRAGAITGGCPEMYADATEDPRLRG
jgi:zinc D-Ala-D-Ala carboxypeptidase